MFIGRHVVLFFVDSAVVPSYIEAMKTPELEKLQKAVKCRAFVTPPEAVDDLIRMCAAVIRARANENRRLVVKGVVKIGSGDWHRAIALAAEADRTAEELLSVLKGAE